MVNMLLAQSALLSDSQLLPSLTNAMSKMSNLSTLQTTSSGDILDCINSFEEATDDLPRFKFFAASLRAETFLRNPFEQDAESGHDCYQLQPISHMITAAAMPSYTLTILSISAIPITFRNLNKPFGNWSSTRHVIGDALVNLRSLKVRLLADRDLASVPSAYQQVAHYLGSAQSLSKLEVEIDTARLQSEDMSNLLDRVYDNQAVLWDISDIMDNLQLPHLKTIKIDRFCVAEESFTSFMRKHASNLQDLLFITSYMMSPDDRNIRISSWERALRKLAPNMLLKHVDLGLFEDSLLSAVLHQKTTIDPGKFNEVRKNYSAFRCRVSNYLESNGQTEYPKFTAT
ncbi:MAG: hypothetical protein Q9181_003965 [Wetmoreana brouardii]